LDFVNLRNIGAFVAQEETEEEEILLQPIGPGMQNLEPEGSGTLRQRSMTPVFLPEQQGRKYWSQ